MKNVNAVFIDHSMYQLIPKTLVGHVNATTNTLLVTVQNRLDNVNANHNTPEKIVKCAPRVTLIGQAANNAHAIIMEA